MISDGTRTVAGLRSQAETRTLDSCTRSCTHEFQVYRVNLSDAIINDGINTMAYVKQELADFDHTY